MITDKVNLISATNAAKRLGISVPVVYQLCRSRVSGFPAFRIGERYLVSEEGLELWIEEQLDNRTEVELS